MIGEMVARVREVDPQFFERFDNDPMEDLPEWHQPPHDGEAFAPRIRRATRRPHFTLDRLFAQRTIAVDG